MNFEMTGKLSISKETEKFHPWSEKTYPSGWVRRQLMFNVTCGDNRHMLTVTAGAFEDGHGDVFSFTKGSVDENGKKVKVNQSESHLRKDLLLRNLLRLQSSKSLS